MNWKLAGMAGTALCALALTGVSATAGANKFTGNVSLAVGQTFQDDSFFDEDSFTSISGGGKVNIAFESNLNLELDVIGIGSFIDTSGSERNAGFQAAAHGYWRTSNYAFGAFAGAGVAGGPGGDDAEYYFAGVQGQYYWNNFTFGVDAGYLDSSPSDSTSSDDEFLGNAWFANAEARWYATPKLTFAANVGYISGETVFGLADQHTWHWGAKAEYWPEEKEPLSLWVAYEGRKTEFDFNPGSSDGDSHTIKVGLTFHFGVDGGAQDNDRNGPAFNQMDYGAIVVEG
jgi:hypothetical protein